MWNQPTFVATADSSSSLSNTFVMTLLMVLGAYALNRRSQRTAAILKQNKWMIAFFLYMGLSIIWSNFPAISLRRYIRIVGSLEMVFIVLTEVYYVEAVRVLLRRLYLLHIFFSAVAIKYVRNIGVMYSWDGLSEEWIGLCTDKNSLGQVSMCSGIYWLWQILQDWPKRKLKGGWRSVAVDGVFFAITLWLLGGSKTVHSSTAIIGFVVCVLVILALQLIKKRAANAKRILVGATVATLSIGTIGYLAFQMFDIAPVQTVVQASGRDMTFTDRNLIWTDVLNNAKRSPVLGVGIGAYWVGPIGYQIYPMPTWSQKTPGWRPEEGHNGYIDVYAQLGLAGVALFAVVILSVLAGALDDLQHDFQFGSLRLALFIGILFNNLSESSFVLGTHDLWFLFLLVGINVPRKNVTEENIPNRLVRNNERYRRPPVLADRLSTAR
jgi:O-antigen ligase